MATVTRKKTEGNGRPRLIELAKGLAPSGKTGSKSWIDMLPPESVAEIKELRREFHAGKYPGVTKSAIADLVKQQFPQIVAKRESIIRWLREGE